MKEQINLNTSHVKVQLGFFSTLEIIELYLNTSHVKVQRNTSCYYDIFKAI